MLNFLFPPSLGHIVASARAELLTRWFQRNVNTEISIIIARSYQEMRQAIEQGDADLVWAPPVLCAEFQDRCLAILKAVRGGQSFYRSALIVRRGEVAAIEALKDSRAVWVDRLSTAGYLLPLAHLRGLGHDLDDLFGEQTFAGSYARVLDLIIDREADMGAIYVQDATQQSALGSLGDLLGTTAHGLQVLDFTEPAPSDGLVITHRGDPQDNLQLLGRLRKLTCGDHPTLLLTILNADALELAQPREYDVLVDAVDRLGM